MCRYACAFATGVASILHGACLSARIFGSATALLASLKSANGNCEAACGFCVRHMENLSQVAAAVNIANAGETLRTAQQLHDLR